MKKIDQLFILKAMGFAMEKHAGQKDDAGQDFIIHPMQTAAMIGIVNSHDTNLVAAAWLHDTLEDTDTTYEELVKEFNKDVADLVNEVTHEGDKKTGYYFPRLHTKRGVQLKYADRLSNLSRMSVWPEERQEDYLKVSRFWKTEKGGGK